MTADSEMPERHEIEVTRISPGTRTTESYIDDRYVGWIELRLDRTEAALKAASEALWEHGHDRKGNHIGTHAGKCSLCDLYDKSAALEGKP